MNLVAVEGDDQRREVALRLSAIEGVTIPEAALNKRPSFKLGVLSGSGNLEKFLAAFDWMLSEIKEVQLRSDSDLLGDRPEGTHFESSASGTPG